MQARYKKESPNRTKVGSIGLSGWPMRTGGLCFDTVSTNARRLAPTVQGGFGRKARADGENMYVTRPAACSRRHREGQGMPGSCSFAEGVSTGPSPEGGSPARTWGREGKEGPGLDTSASPPPSAHPPERSSSSSTNRHEPRAPLRCLPRRLPPKQPKGTSREEEAARRRII